MFYLKGGLLKQEIHILGHFLQLKHFKLEILSIIIKLDS